METLTFTAPINKENEIKPDPRSLKNNGDSASRFERASTDGERLHLNSHAQVFGEELFLGSINMKIPVMTKFFLLRVTQLHKPPTNKHSPWWWSLCKLVIPD